MLGVKLIQILAAASVICLQCIFSLKLQLGEDERVVQTLEDEIFAENFTYYRLQRDGYLKLVLVSLEGDVDIYVSSETQHPSFNKYDLKSETCGVDKMRISQNMARPIFIGLYGHPNYHHSRFSLSIVSLPMPKTISYEDLVAKYERYYIDQEDYESFGDKSAEGNSFSSSDKSDSYNEEEMPLWWKILVCILKFGLEVIL